MSRSTLMLAGGILVLCLGGPLRADDDVRKVTHDTLDRAIKALGGADVLARLKTATVKIKSKATLPDNTEVDSSESWSVKGLDRYRVAATTKVGDNNFDVIIVINGPKGWLKVGNNPAKEWSKEAVIPTRHAFRAVRLVHVLHQLKEKPFELSPLGEMKVDGKDAVGLRIIQKDRPDVSLFFDKKTGLPVKGEVRVADPESGQDGLLEIFFASLKDFDGVKHFAKITVKRDGKPLVDAEVEGVKSEDVDDGSFDKP